MTLQEKLRALHHVDLQVRGLRSRLDARSRRLDNLNAKLAQFQRQHAELTEQLKLAKVQTHNLETEVGTADARIQELRDRMNNVTSNKEYSALLVEVNTLKIEKSEAEEKALEAMDKTEATQTQIAEVDAKIADQQKLVRGAQNELAEAEAEVKDRLDEVTAERDDAAREIDGETLRVYDRLAHNHDGEALAEIEEQDRRRMEYTCGECYMALPIQAVNAAMSNPDALVNCPNCGRILVITSDLKAAIGSK